MSLDKREVPMHDLVGMHRSDRGHHVVSNVASLFLRNVVPVQNDVEQFLPVAVLSDDVLELSHLKNLVNFYYVGVVLYYAALTRLLRREISLRIIVLALANLRVFIFLMALWFPVC